MSWAWSASSFEVRRRSRHGQDFGLLSRQHCAAHDVCVRQRQLVVGLVALVVVAGMSACAKSDHRVDLPRGTAATSAKSTMAPSFPPVPTATPSSSPNLPRPTSSTPKHTPSAPTTSTPRPTGIPGSLLGKEWSVIPTTRHVVALTFDAGANDAGLSSIL